MRVDESSTPMLEMSSRVRGSSVPIEIEEEPEEPSTPSSSKKIVGKESAEEAVGMAAEFAVGTGIPSSWDAEDPETGDYECEAEARLTRLARRCTRAVCKCLGARRLGHMAVLSTSQVHAVTKADDKAEERTALRCMVGPFWPFAFSVTYPLIVCVSATVAVVLLPGHSIVTILLWVLAVASLLVALSCTACRNPGILRRHATQPHSSWRWNDQARTFRPPGAVYDGDLGLIVEHFDHVCPWTGTAIGGNNLCAFHAFVSILCVCIIFDILLVMRILP